MGPDPGLAPGRVAACLSTRHVTRPPLTASFDRLSGLLAPHPPLLTSCPAGSLTGAFPQGVTLTDLQEAERTFSRSRAERQAQEQPGQKPVGTGGLELPAGPTTEAGEGRRGRGPDTEVSSLRRALGWAGDRVGSLR